jgi:methyl-accepting chemotaxis protein
MNNKKCLSGIVFANLAGLLLVLLFKSSSILITLVFFLIAYLQYLMYIKVSKNLVTTLKIEVKEPIGSNLNSVLVEIENLTASSLDKSKVTKELGLSFVNMTEDTLNGIEEMVRYIKDTSVTIDEISGAVNQIAVNVQDVATDSSNAIDFSQKGSIALTQVITKMNSIKTAVVNSANIIQGLEKHSLEINKIIEVITGLANQTNLLALNAAIEAARAGESGRGFAVVADEVRKLAEQSKGATEQIAHLIKDIQQVTNSAVEAMTEINTEVDQGNEVVGQARSTFGQIVQAINKVNSEIGEISAATEQVAASTGTINSSIAEVQGKSPDLDSKVLEQKIKAILQTLEGIEEDILDLRKVINKLKK